MVNVGKWKEGQIVDPKLLEAWALTVGRTVAAIRERRSLSQDGLATSAGLSRGTISHIENGSEGASIGALIACLLALGEDIWSIFGGKSSTRPNKIEDRILHDLIDEIVAKRSDQLTAAVREVLKSFAGRP